MLDFKINLKELWTTDYWLNHLEYDIPWCIYKITNLINNQSYIGQAKSFYGRFLTNGFNHLSAYKDYCINGGNTYLYNSIRTYKSKNFEVSIIDVVPDSIEDKRSKSNELERYWIKELHTCIYDKDCNGYNMTWGGEDASNLHDLETIETKLINKINSCFNILKSKKLSITPRNYICESEFSSFRFAMNHVDLITDKFYVNPPITSHKLWTNQMNELFQWFNQYQDWDTIKKVLGIDQSTSYLINEIIYKIELLKSKNLILNAENYFNYSEFSSIGKLRGHVNSIISRYDQEYPIYSDPRWTKDMSTIFNEFKSNYKYYFD